MKKNYPASLFLLSLAFIPLAHGNWISIADVDTYSPSWTEDELRSNTGWVYQDGNYYGYPNCVDGTDDCTAWRAVANSPYSFESGSDISFEHRSGDPSVAGLANTATNSAKALPQEIPLDGKATVYIHFALESEPGNRFFCLADQDYENVGPVVSSNSELKSYGDSGVIMNLGEDYRLDVHQGGYVPAIEDPNDADANLLEAETWYHMWIQVDNQALTGGDTLGSRYNLYIAGGKFGTEPVHLVNTVDGYADAGYTAWFFRRNVDEPVRTFNIIGQYGNPADNVQGTGALWINSLMMYPGEFVLDVPSYPDGTSTTPIDDAIAFFEASAHTNFWLAADGIEWVYGEHYPWIYSQAEGGWLYCYEQPGATFADGSWFYDLSAGTYVYITSDSYPYVYVHGQGWVQS